MPQLTRRQFVQRSGQVVAAGALASQLGWLSACGGNGSPDWQQLADRLDGSLVVPTDGAYARVSLPQNRRYANVRPRGIVLCRSPADARESLLWARDVNMPIAVRSGGHNYAGYSTTDGLLIDLGRMKAVKVKDAGTAVRAEAGARNTDVYAGLQPHGVGISAGRCPTVAIGGLVLGGGVGFSSRKLGLTCDQLTQAEMVTPAGDLVTCSRGENQDLFWALRGGGGGNFGICTSYEFATRPVGDVTLYDIEWEWRDAARVFAAFQGVMADAPDEFSARLGLGRPGGRATIAGAPTISALGQFFGSKGDLVALLDPALTAARPRSQLIAPRTFWQAKNYFFHTTPRGYYEVKSSYATRPLSDPAIQTLVDWIERWPGSSNTDGAGVAMFASGGAINRVPADATAFVHRDEFALIATETSWTGHDSESVAGRNLDWIESFAEAMSPHVSGFAYQNFIDRSQPDWQNAYYGSNLERLTEIKSRHDPDDVFSFQQSIPRA